ncbi:MAG TPA: putative DNA modification/repair radical SAM protein [Firmicutes bacterium]|nr:putative DNA modification/repair radical SAM protein [Bacillota bacterium]
MELIDKLQILGESAKYDAACTSSGVQRGGKRDGGIGSTAAPGLCHSFSADGRCISLLKVLMTNYCICDCKYCINRISNDIPRAAFTPEEIARLTIEFYKRNYIEGLFLSSGIIRNPDYAMEQMCRAISLLRHQYHFNGYIHAKAIPGASPELIQKMGMLADRMSVNIELPSEQSLNKLAPDKSKSKILKPMAFIRDGITENQHDLQVYRHAPQFTPAGQSTQMIIGATPDTDFQIMRLSESLYQKYALRRVFYSAYIPVGDHALIPVDQPAPLLREHRLYQADWLLRFYGFKAAEILSEDKPSLDPMLDPKCHWALNNLWMFPVDVNRASLETLLRVPGIGPTSARRIVTARRLGPLHFDDLRKLRVVMKRAIYFITCSGKYAEGIRFDYRFIYANLTADTRQHPGSLPDVRNTEQLSLFSTNQPVLQEDYMKCLTGQM